MFVSSEENLSLRRMIASMQDELESTMYGKCFRYFSYSRIKYFMLKFMYI